MGLKNVIKHSIAATTSESAMELRKSHVKEIEPVFKRLIIQSIDTAVFALPLTMSALDRAAMSRHGYEYIGSGAESRVYRKDDSVFKYVKNSDQMASHERRYLSDKKTEEFDLLRKYMTSFVLDQTISVAPHAVKKDVEVVQTTQPHVQFLPLVERVGWEGAVRIESADTNLLDGLSNFIDASWQLFGESGLVPDINGTRNLVQVGKDVILLDTQPISPDITEAHGLIQRQLGSLASLLEKIS